MIYIEFILSFIDVIKFIFEWFMKKKKGKIFEKAIYIDFISNFPYGCKKKIFLNNQVMCRKKTGMRIYFFSHIHLNICIIFLFIQVLIFILYRVFIKNYFLIEDSCRLKIKLFTNSTQHLWRAGDWLFQAIICFVKRTLQLHFTSPRFREPGRPFKNNLHGLLMQSKKLQVLPANNCPKNGVKVVGNGPYRSFKYQKSIQLDMIRCVSRYY